MWPLTSSSRQKQAPRAASRSVTPARKTSKPGRNAPGLAGLAYRRASLWCWLDDPNPNARPLDCSPEALSALQALPGADEQHPKGPPEFPADRRWCHHGFVWRCSRHASMVSQPGTGQFLRELGVIRGICRPTDAEFCELLFLRGETIPAVVREGTDTSEQVTPYSTEGKDRWASGSESGIRVMNW